MFQRPALLRQWQAKLPGQHGIDPLIVEMAQAAHIRKAQLFNAVAPRGMGKVGRVVTARNIGISTQVFKDSSALPCIIPIVVGIGSNRAVALGPGPQHHHFLIAIGQVRIVGNGFKQLGIAYARPHPAQVLFIEQAAWAAIITMGKGATGLGQPDQFLGIS